MPDTTIETPVSSGATDQPDVPQSGDLQDIRQNASGQRIGFDSTQNAWVDTNTRKPYSASTASTPTNPTSLPALPRQDLTKDDLVRNPTTGQMLAWDKTQNGYVDLVTRKLYHAPNPADKAGKSTEPFYGEGTGQEVTTEGSKQMAQGVAQEAGSVAKSTLWGGVPSVVQGLYEDVTKNLPATVRVYEQARASGKSVSDSLAAMNAKAKEIQQAKLGLNQRIKEFSTNPDKATGRAIVDGVLATLGGVGLVDLIPEAGTAGAVSVEAPAAETVAEPRGTPGYSYQYEQQEGGAVHQVTARNAEGTPVATVRGEEESPNTITTKFSASQESNEGLNAYDRLASQAKIQAERTGKPVTLQGDSVDDLSPSARRTWQKLGEQKGYDVAWDNGDPATGRPSIRFAPKAEEIPLTPVEIAAKERAAQAGISEGLPSQETPSITPGQIQESQRQAILSEANRVADEEGVSRPHKDSSIRDIDQHVGEGIENKATGIFKKLDDAMMNGGRFQTLYEKIKNTSRALLNLTDSPEDIAKEAQFELGMKTSEQSLADALDQAKEKLANDPDVKIKDPQKLIDEGNRLFRKAQALYDHARHVRMTTTGMRPGMGELGTQTPETTNAGSLNTRYNRSYNRQPKEPVSRMNQAYGDEGSQRLLTATDNAKIAAQQIKDFVPTTATGQQALTDLLKENTTPKTKITGTKIVTDYNESLKSFEKLTGKEQTARFPGEVDQVRKFLQSKAYQQTAIKLLKWAGATAAGGTIWHEAGKIF
jgi:hypothetical protein